MGAINHLGFIASAYAAAIVAVVGLSAWVMLDYRVLRRRLLDLDARGIARRSAGKPAEPAKEPVKEEA